MYILHLIDKAGARVFLLSVCSSSMNTSFFTKMHSDNLRGVKSTLKTDGHKVF